MSKLRINKIGVLSVAKIYALMMLVISLIISIPYGLFIMVFGAAMMGAGGREGLMAGGGGIVMACFYGRAADILRGDGFCFRRNRRARL
jgi:hypothetical protein